MVDERRLNEHEVALVFRRAAELDSAHSTVADGGIEEAALVQAAEEAGLSAAAVRQALAELRLGTLTAESRRRRRLPRVTDGGVSRIERSVRAPKEEVERALAQFLVGERFVVRRRPEGHSIWEPERGKSRRRSRLKQVDGITIAVVERGEFECVVCIDLDMRERSRYVLQATTAGAVFGGGGPALLLAGVGIEIWALMTVPLGAAMTYAIWRSERTDYDTVRTRAADAIELLLDELDRKRAARD